MVDYNEKMIAAKAKLLERFKEQGPRQIDAERERLPPGQHLTTAVPGLDLGGKPKFNPERWRFKVEGAVEESLDLSWEEFAELPRASQISDFHCVTPWSKFDVEWDGV